MVECLEDIKAKFIGFIKSITGIDLGSQKGGFGMGNLKSMAKKGLEKGKGALKMASFMKNIPSMIAKMKQRLYRLLADFNNTPLKQSGGEGEKSWRR